MKNMIKTETLFNRLCQMEEDLKVVESLVTTEVDEVNFKIQSQYSTIENCTPKVPFTKEFPATKELLDLYYENLPCVSVVEHRSNRLVVAISPVAVGVREVFTPFIKRNEERLYPKILNDLENVYCSHYYNTFKNITPLKRETIKKSKDSLLAWGESCVLTQDESEYLVKLNSAIWEVKSLYPLLFDKVRSLQWELV